MPVAQYDLKNTGKNPAMTVVANAEFAQSYKAQDHCARRRLPAGPGFISS